jgi:hypothetical protein
MAKKSDSKEIFGVCRSESTSSSHVLRASIAATFNLRNRRNCSSDSSKTKSSKWLCRSNK